MAYNGKRSQKGKTKSRNSNAAAANGSVGRRDDSDSAAVEGKNEVASNPGNDVSWYTRYPNLVAAAGTFPYPYRPGMDLQFGSFVNSSGTHDAAHIKSRIPGVMVLNWAPTVGRSNSATDPASILGKEMYSRVRAAYSGTLRADAPDYVIYVMALDSIFSYIAWLKRLYRTMNVWSSENYVVPDTLLYAMGLTDPDIQSLRAERTKLWQLINQLVLQSRKFTCPGSLDIINRHYWMNDNVYTDADAINSQFYMFNQQYRLKYFFGYFEGEDDPLGQVGGLVPEVYPWVRNAGTTERPYFTLTPEFLYQYGLDMIEALVEWDDAYTINGYLQRAYAGDPLFIVEELPIDATLVPIYNPEVLVQIENSQAIPGDEFRDWTDSKAGLTIKQNPKTNAIISNPGFVVASSKPTDLTGSNSKYYPYAWLGMNTMLNSRSNMPGPLDNVVASRLIGKIREYANHTPVGSTTVDGISFYVDVGSEVPISWHAFGNENGTEENSKFDGTSSSATIFGQRIIHQFRNITSGANISLLDFYKISEVGQFDWHPILFWCDTVNRGSDGDISVYINGDIHNATTISLSELANLHRVCLFSEFNSFSMS